MSEFNFGVGRTRLTRAQIVRRERVARKHGAWFICGDFPDGYRSWFGKRNEGAPFDGATARAVLSDLAAVEGGAQ